MDKNTVREIIKNMRNETAKKLMVDALICGVQKSAEAGEIFNDFYNTITELNEARE